MSSGSDGRLEVVIAAAVVAAALLVLAVWAVRLLLKTRSDACAERGKIRDALSDQLARGDITAEQYRAALADLGDPDVGRPHPNR